MMTTAAAPTSPLRAMGRPDFDVSLFGLGAMTFGAEADEAEARRMLDLFVARGGRLVDTADVYGAGRSEEIIGRWGRDRGGFDDIVLATKGRFSGAPGRRGASRSAIRRSVEASLARLQADAIDLYFIHGWDDAAPIEETVETLSDLIRAGKLRHFGYSNLTGWQLERLVWAARACGAPKPVALQPHYNLLERGAEWDLIPCALENGIGLTPWSPLAGGWLTGKYARDARPTGATRLGEDPDRGVEAYDRRNTDRTHAILAALGDVADRLGRAPAHVALAWLAQRPGVSSLLLGARNATQLSASLDASDLVLSPEDHDALTAASAPGVPDYPHAFVRQWSGLTHWDRLGAID